MSVTGFSQLEAKLDTGIAHIFDLEEEEY